MRRIQTSLYTREATDVAIDGDRVSFAFSSEAGFVRRLPEHGHGLEVLDHSPGSVRLDRLRNRAAALVNHDMDQYVGDVVAASVGKDRKGRATVEFAPNELAQSVKADITAGFRGKISVGYRIHKVVVEERGKNKIPVFRVTDWEPHEVSFVTIAADDTVGVGRAAADHYITEVRQMGDEIHGPQGEGAGEEKEKIAVTGGVSLEQHAAARARSEEQTRAAEIRKIAKIFEWVPAMERLADDCIAQGIEIAKFRDLANDELKRHNDAQGTVKPRTDLGMEQREIKRYSILRALDAMYCQARGEGIAAKIAPFELECSAECAREIGREPHGLFVPFDVQQHSSWRAPQSDIERAVELGLMLRTPPMGVGTASTVAAGLKGTALMAENFIEALRPATVAIRAGATLLPGLVSDITIPKQTGRAAFTWLAEDDSSADTETPIGLVSLTPKTVSGSVPITRKLMKQATPAVEGLVRNDLVNGAAEAIDLGAFEGTGASNQPLGIVGTSGVLTQAVGTDAAPTFVEMVGFETAVNGANALRYGGVAYVTTPAIFGVLKTTAKDTGSGLFVNENSMVNGYPIYTSSQLTTSRIIFGAYANLLIGMWGVLDLMMDTATNAAKGRLTIRAFQDIDITVRHAQSFCIGT